MIYIEQIVAKEQRGKNKDVLNPLVCSDKFEILYHEYNALNGTCLYTSDITITIVNSKEDGT